MREFWDSRYQQAEYVYGTNANVFFAETLLSLQTGKLLLPCEGEGRNAVFAAKNGWQVEAFDYSLQGKEKALQLAAKQNVSIDYQIIAAEDFDFGIEKYDAIAFIYAHYSPTIRKNIHQKAISALKKGGTLIMEVFNPKQLQNTSGGPKDVAMLYTCEILAEDFADLQIDFLAETETLLSEGNFHQGKADIVRLIAKKK